MTNIEKAKKYIKAKGEKLENINITSMTRTICSERTCTSCPFKIKAKMNKSNTTICAINYSIIHFWNMKEIGKPVNSCYDTNIVNFLEFFFSIVNNKRLKTMYFNNELEELNDDNESYLYNFLTCTFFDDKKYEENFKKLLASVN